jgi:hypothetical protein
MAEEVVGSPRAVLCGTNNELGTLAALAGARTISDRGTKRDVRSKSNVQAYFIARQCETVGIAAGFIVTERAAQKHFVNRLAGRAIALSRRRTLR